MTISQAVKILWPIKDDKEALQEILDYVERKRKSNHLQLI